MQPNNTSSIKFTALYSTSSCTKVLKSELVFEGHQKLLISGGHMLKKICTIAGIREFQSLWKIKGSEAFL